MLYSVPICYRTRPLVKPDTGHKPRKCQKLLSSAFPRKWMGSIGSGKMEMLSYKWSRYNNNSYFNLQVSVYMSPVKQICVFEHSGMTNFNCACPAIQRDLAFCLKVPLDSLLVWASSEGSGETARMRRLAWTFAARIGDKYQIRLTRSI